MICFSFSDVRTLIRAIYKNACVQIKYTVEQIYSESLQNELIVKHIFSKTMSKQRLKENMYTKIKKPCRRCEVRLHEKVLRHEKWSLRNIKVAIKLFKKINCIIGQESKI